MNNPCSWCLAETGVQPQPGESHGICPRHAELMREEIKQCAGRRYDSQAFSAAVVVGCLIFGTLLCAVAGAWVAVKAWGWL